MTRRKSEDPTRGERAKLNMSLSVAAKRSWNKRLSQAQEDVENAEMKRDQLMAEAYEAGIAYAAMEASTGLGPMTVRKSVDAHTRRAQEDL